MGRRLYVVAVLCALLAVASVASAFVMAPSPSEERASIEALTASEMAGRRSGTEGGDRAAALIASWLSAAGLRPGGDRGTFLQSFPAARAVVLGPDNALAAGGAPLVVGRDWTPHGGSRTGAVRGTLVFAGYGLPDEVRGGDADAGVDGREAYGGVDAQDAIVLLLDGAPAGRRATRLEKLLVARHHGARAVLIVAPSLPTLSATRAPVDVVSATLTHGAADVLLAATGRTLADLERAPVAVALDMQVTLRVDLAAQERHGANVIGILPGSDPDLANEAVVVGAHYDHLGVVKGVVHPGADDNASGTSLVVSLARAFAAAGGTSRTLVFALFGGEELGLLGSRYYIEHPAVPLDRTAAMLNFDMVGRLHGATLRVGGVDSGSRLRDAVTEAATAAGVRVELNGSPFAASDHSPFYGAHAPVLFFFTGTHADYHRPSDTADKIDADGLARVAALGADVLARLATGARPRYAALPSPARGGRARARGVSPGGAFLGVGGDAGESDGAAITHVVPGSAAARAGLRGGDVIVRLGSTAVDSFEDLRSAIGRQQPGDTVEVVYLRDGRDHATSATLERSIE